MSGEDEGELLQVLLLIWDDRAEDHHDIEIEDETGRRLARARLPEGLGHSDKKRFSDARARKNYSRQSPITRASGKKSVVMARYATNRRLGTALHLPAFSALVASPGPRAYYDELRARKIGHHAARRQLANRLVGILHGCLKTGTNYDENTAWHHPQRSLLDRAQHGMSAKCNGNTDTAQDQPIEG